MTKDDRQNAREILEESGLDEVAEANLLWDEYKYRHDLIWQHLIRSTLALVALATVRFVPEFSGFPMLTVFAFFAALLYWVITFVAIDRELHLYLQVKAWHRFRQKYFLGLHDHDESAGRKPDFSSVNRRWGRIYFDKGFPKRVGFYLLLLLVGIILMAPICEMSNYVTSSTVPLSNSC